MEAIRGRDDEIRERLCAQDRAGRPIVRDALVSRIGNERFHKRRNDSSQGGCAP